MTSAPSAGDGSRDDLRDGNPAVLDKAPIPPAAINPAFMKSLRFIVKSPWIPFETGGQYIIFPEFAMALP